MYIKIPVVRFFILLQVFESVNLCFIPCLLITWLNWLLFCLSRVFCVILQLQPCVCFFCFFNWRHLLCTAYLHFTLCLHQTPENPEELRRELEKQLEEWQMHPIGDAEEVGKLSLMSDWVPIYARWSMREPKKNLLIDFCSTALSDKRCSIGTVSNRLQCWSDYPDCPYNSAVGRIYLKWIGELVRFFFVRLLAEKQKE